MTVYVDDMRISAAVGSRLARWSHLIADTEEELHEFATTRLGLKREWFQDPRTVRRGLLGPAVPGTYAAAAWHYDVTDSKRTAAIAAGAVEVPWHELITVGGRRKNTVRRDRSPTPGMTALSRPPSTSD